MPNAGVSVSPGRTYRGEEDPETGEGWRSAERRTDHTSSERTARLPRDGAGRAIRPPHVRLASMADVTAELDFTPRPRARRTSGPAAPRSTAAARATTAPRPVAAEDHQSVRLFDSERASQTAEPPAVIPGSASAAGGPSRFMAGAPSDTARPPSAGGRRVGCTSGRASVRTGLRCGRSCSGSSSCSLPPPVRTRRR